MNHHHLAVLTALVTLVVPSSVFGQESNDAWGGRVFVTFNVGVQTNSRGLGYEFTTPLFGQSAMAGLNVPGTSGVTFDVGAGLRLVQNLGVGVTYSRYSNQREGTLTTTTPDPWCWWNGCEFSTITAQIPLQREEDAVHIQAVYRVPLGTRVQVGAFGGPSYFRCADDHITRFALAAPNTSTGYVKQFFETAQMIDRSSVWGYHGGGSFTYLATTHVGVGMTVRYSQASHTTTNHFSDTTYLRGSGIWGGENATGSFTMKHGGIQWNGGISLHF
jgi:hypothetical protein